jgi:hypothetical protein
MCSLTKRLYLIHAISKKNKSYTYLYILELFCWDTTDRKMIDITDVDPSKLMLAVDDSNFFDTADVFHIRYKDKYVVIPKRLYTVSSSDLLGQTTLRFSEECIKAFRGIQAELKLIRTRTIFGITDNFNVAPETVRTIYISTEAEFYDVTQSIVMKLKFTLGSMKNVLRIHFLLLSTLFPAEVLMEIIKFYLLLL